MNFLCLTSKDFIDHLYFIVKLELSHGTYAGIESLNLSHDVWLKMNKTKKKKKNTSHGRAHPELVDFPHD